MGFGGETPELKTAHRYNNQQAFHLTLPSSFPTAQNLPYAQSRTICQALAFLGAWNKR